MSGHFWSFVHTTWEMLRNALSTSNLSLAVFSLCIPLAVFVVAVVVKWNEARSLNGLVVALKASVKPVLIGVGVTVVAWLCLFSWALYKSVYNDHQNLTGRLHAVVNEKDALKVTLKQRDDYIKRLEQAGPLVITRTLPAPRHETEIPKLEGTRFVQERIEGIDASWPWRRHVTIQTDETLHDPKWKLECDSDCEIEDQNVSGGGMHGHQRVSSKAWEVYVAGEFSPARTFNIFFRAKQQFKIISMKRVY